MWASYRLLHDLELNFQIKYWAGELGYKIKTNNIKKKDGRLSDNMMLGQVRSGQVRSRDFRSSRVIV